MRNKRWIIFPVFLSLAFAACAPTTEPQNEPLEPDGSTVVQKEILETEPVFENFENSPELIIHEEIADCGDPFDGENIDFFINYWESTNFCLHSIPYAEISSGGPPPDGIPPIDLPKFVDINEADQWIDDFEPVIAFSVDNDWRAYPLQILTWHEIVNDTVGDLPVVVTFCPLCNTALVFERPLLEGKPLTFGVSGNLRNSDLVMWDRHTQSWWQQFSGEAIVGKLTGSQLKLLPSSTLSWADFKAKYPQGKVLSKDTGYNRDYGRNPYAGYDNANSLPFLFSGEYDDRLRAMDRVLGILLPDGNGQAYSLIKISEEIVINDTLGATPFVIFWKAGTASALDSSLIAEGTDVGATAVFERTVNGQSLTFIPNRDGTFADQETGSTWDILGEAIAGSMTGTQLVAIPHHDTFWFAWAAFLPPDSLVR